MSEPTAILPHTIRGKGRKGAPIVLLHGFGGDQLAWAGLTGPMARMRPTITVDMPGHGEAVDWPGPVNVGVCANAVAATLDGLGIGRAFLVGHSMGGAVASLVGLKRPDLVEGLVLLAPGGFGPEMNVRLLKRYAAMVDQDEIGLVVEQFFAPTSTIPPSLPRLVAEQRAPEPIRRSFAAIVDAISQGNGQGVLPLADLAAQPFPISLVWGLEDQVLPVSQAIGAPAEMARHLVPAVGHMPHMEAPDLVLRVIGQAIGRRD